LPLLNKSSFDSEVERYWRPHGAWATRVPPFEFVVRKTYPTFFNDTATLACYREHWLRAADWSFTPGVRPNWEAQQPPLYYLMMAAVMRATEVWSLPSQVFTLRVFSFALAFIGLLIGWRATARNVQKPPHCRRIFVYPFIFPCSSVSLLVSAMIHFAFCYSPSTISSMSGSVASDCRRTP
jgi:hypothetical protein